MRIVKNVAKFNKRIFFNHFLKRAQVSVRFPQNNFSDHLEGKQFQKNLSDKRLCFTYRMLAENLRFFVVFFNVTSAFTEKRFHDKLQRAWIEKNRRN